MRYWLLVLLVLVPTGARALSLTGEVHWSGVVHQHEAVRVEPGATLIIAPGSTVVFSGGSLEVAGRLRAREVDFNGQDWTGIVLKRCDLNTLIADCRVSGAATGILVAGGEPRIEGTRFVDNRIGLELRQQAAATVSGCDFRNNRRVGLFVKDEATAAVVDNNFINNGKFGAYIFRAKPRRFAGNSFNSNPIGIMVSHYGSDPLLEENCLTGNKVAIRIDRAAKPILRRNDIRDNGTGLYLYRRADPLVEGNRIADNRTGIHVAFSSYPQIHGNDLNDNIVALQLEYQSSTWDDEKGAAARKAEVAGSPFGGQKQGEVSERQRAPRQLDGTVDARDNWWGKGGTLELARLGRDGNPSFINDGRDTPSFDEGGKSYPLDTVRFAPWRKEAVWH